jgi:LEA14-like dessication related protein
MTAPRRITAMLAMTLVLVTGCTALGSRDALQVTVSGVEALPGEGLELRLLLKLRVQNPNDQPIEYDGIALRLDVQGRAFATGVSDERGTVPRFGEAVITVPVTVSALRMVRQVVGLLDGQPVREIRYAMSGKLQGPGFGARRFGAEGQFTLPGSAGAP